MDKIHVGFIGMGRRGLVLLENVLMNFPEVDVVAICDSMDGKFCVIPKTNSKKFRMKLKEMNQWLKEHRNLPLKKLMPKLNQKLIGHYRYYGVTYNIQMLVKYHYYVTKMLFKWLNRRSQKGSYTWEQFHMMQTYYPIAYPKRYVNLYE